ncbi:type II toxin-antitoxin system RelE/ParE family toxin [Dyella thiooxydans]|uniref:type II toxin-antitoxin system RelE/ParE family toxin n=1 Tax=Dyella thiooxydans TaxID=445710 RepID=UPI000A0494FA|nr:type II toxin-antitoxin system RelE/ParE family toxin [Dyella thiooxydans]
MIHSVSGPLAKELYSGQCPKELELCRTTAERKLTYLDSVVTLEALRYPPGNRLEKLMGNRTGQYSIRINDQYRICFRWENDGPHDVEITDYH